MVVATERTGHKYVNSRSSWIPEDPHLDVTCASPSVVSHWDHLATEFGPQDQNHSDNRVVPVSSIVLDTAEVPGEKIICVFELDGNCGKDGFWSWPSRGEQSLNPEQGKKAW